MEFLIDFMPHLITICILYLYNLNSYYISVKSFERFLSKKSAEERLNVVINLFTDGILIISENNQILYSNAHFNDLLGCHQDEILRILGTVEYSQGRKYTNLTPSNYLIDDINWISALQVNQEICLGLSSTRGNNLEWKGKKVLWDEKEAVLIIAHNANNIIQLEQALSDNKLKNILLRSVSHELRTPINAISFLAESLLSETLIAENNEWKEKLNMISVSSKLLISLINDLLDYSRMLTGVFTVQKSKFLLRDVISNTIQLIKIQAEKKGLSVITRIDPGLPAFAFTDPLRFSQILLNLLSNSLKFTLKGFIEVCCTFSTESKLKVAVYDTGIGVEEDKVKSIFEEFHTIRSPNNPNGCGLGLSISNRIAKALGGQVIEVQSIVNEGSIFSFVSDIMEESPIEIRIAEEIDLRSISEEKLSISIKDINKIKDDKNFAKVLIVDDNEFNRMILGEILKSNNILYNEVCTGKQAVDTIIEMDKKRRPYQIVIMDGSMPEMNGWDATKRIICLYKSKVITNLPIVIGYTAYTSEADLALCLKSGMKECLIKPGNPKSILDVIHRYLLI